MANNAQFFENKSCQYYPCHENMAEINCLFCFCPLYFLTCGSTKQKRTSHGIKDCSDCTYPHVRENYHNIINRLLKEAK